MSYFDTIHPNNLHHAYLIEGARDSVMLEMLVLLKNLNVETAHNPDYTHINIDNFKIDEALSLRQMGTERSLTSAKKIFVITANTFSLDAQQALLKLFEEPIDNTHFFVIVPEIDSLIKTLISRFYVIKISGNNLNLQNAEVFLASPYTKRIEFIKELLLGEDEENIASDSPRSKALKFLNALEVVLHQQLRTRFNLVRVFEQLFKTREYLRQPGSATKTLMESVALAIPVLQ